MEYAIVVLNYNNYDLTKKCAENLLDIIGDNIIVIVDNKSVNESYTILKDYFTDKTNVHVIQSNENRGYAAGNNIGLKYIGENFKEISYYVVMNPDVYIDDSMIFSKLIKRLKNNSDIACISPLMIFNGELNLDNCSWSIPSKTAIYRDWLYLDTRRKKNILHYESSKISYVDSVPGSFFMIKKSVYYNIGFFDENTFLYNEEIILALKIRELGMKNAVVLDAFYHHNHIKGKRKKLKDKIKGLRIANSSRMYLCKKYYPAYCFFLLKCVCAINTVKLVIKHLLGNIYYYKKQ